MLIAAGRDALKAQRYVPLVSRFSGARPLAQRSGRLAGGAGGEPARGVAQ